MKKVQKLKSFIPWIVGFPWSLTLGIWALPALARAHEVYVLNPSEIASGINTPPFNGVQVALDNMHQFVFWAFIGFVAVSTIACISFFHLFENYLEPLFKRGERYASAIARITVALGLLAGAYYAASYGPELPLVDVWGPLAGPISGIAAIAGIMLLFNIYSRIAALIALALFAVNVFFHGIYMLTYANYLGEFIVLLLATHGASKKIKGVASLSRQKFAPYSWLILRVFFGISLFYSSLYAKVLHNQLALEVAALPLAGHPHGIAWYFGFEPHFMVLGAAIIEMLLALFFIIGFEIRWSCIFLEFWLILSMWWFGESVWPHLILFGLPIALFLHGYDRYTIQWYVFGRKGKQRLA